MDRPRMNFDSYYDPPDEDIWNEDCDACADTETECAKCTAERAAYNASEKAAPVWDESSPQYERTATVISDCDKQHIPYNDDTPEFVGISSDMQERDVLTFICPKCNQQHESLVYG